MIAAAFSNCLPEKAPTLVGTLPTATLAPPTPQDSAALGTARAQKQHHYQDGGKKKTPLRPAQRPVSSASLPHSLPGRPYLLNC